MGFDLGAIGEWSPPEVTEVGAEATRAYAAATNDPHPRHRSGELAPPLFAVVPARPGFGWAITRVTPPEVLLRVVHLEHDLRLERPIVPGSRLTTETAAIGVQARSSGTVLVVKARTRDDDGPVNEQYLTLFFRGVTGGDSAGEPPPEHRLSAEVRNGEPLATVTEAIDGDQTYRYADASGDRMPIHLDDAVARAVGLPGIIVHGLCTMAFAGRAVVDSACSGDPTRLSRLAVRFSRPVLPGWEITTRLWRLAPGNGSAGGPSAYGFETAGPDGTVVVKDGLAEVRG